MSVIYVMIPIALVLAGAALAGFAWSVKRGQYDDLDTAPLRAVYDDEADATIPPKYSEKEDGKS